MIFGSSMLNIQTIVGYFLFSWPNSTVVVVDYLQNYTVFFCLSCDALSKTTYIKISEIIFTPLFFWVGQRKIYLLIK